VRWRVKEAREPLLLFNCMDKRSTRWVSVESCLATAILVDKRNEWIQITAPLYNCTCGTSMPRTNLQVLVLVRAPSPFASCWIITFCFWSNASLFASRWMRLDLAVLEISHYFNGPVTRVKLYAHWDLKHGGTLALSTACATEMGNIYSFYKSFILQCDSYRIAWICGCCNWRRTTLSLFLHPSILMVAGF